MTQFNWINYFERLLAKSSLRDTCVSLCLFSIFKNQQNKPWRQITNFKIFFLKSFFKCFDFIQAFVAKGQSNQCSVGRGFLDSELNCNIKSIFFNLLISQLWVNANDLSLIELNWTSQNWIVIFNQFFQLTYCSCSPLSQCQWSCHIRHSCWQRHSRSTWCSRGTPHGGRTFCI